MNRIFRGVVHQLFAIQGVSHLDVQRINELLRDEEGTEGLKCVPPFLEEPVGPAAVMFAASAI